MGAVFSPCRTWRYALTREAAPDGEDTVVFIGLNPSTADETRDDPTTRRCIGFARDWGFARLELVNLFAFAATEPAELRSARDPVGPGNLDAVAEAAGEAGLVVCAWGDDGLGPHADAVLALVARPHCLGLTVRGAPRHPLFVRATVRPQRLGHDPREVSTFIDPKERTVEKIGDGVYHLPDIVGGPSILVDETVVLVDTGVPGSDDLILAAVEEIGRSAEDVTDIVITHADGDHIGSLAALAARTGAVVWAGEHEADVIEGNAPPRRGNTNRTAAVDRRFVPGETLPLQGGIVTVDTHGHTTGHVSLFLPRERILIAGDAINNVEGLGGSREENTANAADARAAVSTLAALKPDSISFGHGPSIVGGAAEQLETLERSLPL